MKIKMLFLFITSAGIFQHTFSNFYVGNQKNLICVSCGHFLSLEEIKINVSDGRPQNYFRCQKCAALSRAKEDEEIDLLAPSEGKSLTNSGVSMWSTVSSVSGESDDSFQDHFYENEEARKLIDEAMWPMPVKRVKKLARVKSGVKGGASRKKIVVRSQFFKKKHTVGTDPMPEMADESTSSFLKNMWLYTFLPSSLGPYCQLQVWHGDKVFTSFSQSPARELWCQGPRSIVVTEDGYTYFDIEKQQRFFFTTKEDLIAHAQAQGFDSELKVVLNEEPSPTEASVSPDSAYDAIVAEYRRRADQIIERYHAENKRIDEEHRARMQEITGKFERLQAS